MNAWSSSDTTLLKKVDLLLIRDRQNTHLLLKSGLLTSVHLFSVALILIRVSAELETVTAGLRQRGQRIPCTGCQSISAHMQIIIHTRIHIGDQFRVGVSSRRDTAVPILERASPPPKKKDPVLSF